MARVTKKRPEQCLSYQHSSLRSEFGEEIHVVCREDGEPKCRSHPTASVSMLCLEVSWGFKVAEGGAEDFPCLAL